MLTQDPQFIRAAVDQAWSRTLGPPVAGVGWDEAGGDSLAAMRLVLELERALGMSLPLDVLGSDTRPEDLAATVASLRGPVARANAPGPILIVAPGLGGDEPALARLRCSLGCAVRFLVLIYPPAADMIGSGASFEAILDAAEKQIGALASSDEIVHLLGYSFGGFVAWNLAARLKAGGRQIGALCLLDTRLPDPVRRRKLTAVWRGRATRLVRHPRQVARVVAWRLAAALFMRAWLPLLRPVSALACRLPGRVGELTRASLIKRLRVRALRTFAPAAPVAPALLLRSTDGGHAASGAGWLPLGAEATFVTIGGSHRTMLDPPWRAALVSRILAAVAACERVSDLRP